MANAMKKAMKELNCKINHLKTLLQRHAEKVKANKDSKYPVKPRGITEFFGQKKYRSTQLICSEYDDDMYCSSYSQEDEIERRLREMREED